MALQDELDKAGEPGRGPVSQSHPQGVDGYKAMVRIANRELPVGSGKVLRPGVGRDPIKGVAMGHPQEYIKVVVMGNVPH